MLLADYFLKEIETYKKDQVREQTYNKYRSNGRFLIKNFSDLILEKMTVMIFWHFLTFWRFLELMILQNS